MPKQKKTSSHLEILRHSTAHILAAAVSKLYPEVKLGIGPTIEDGFYYDFEFPEPITPKELAGIQKEMRRLINSGEVFEKEELSHEEAREKFKNLNQPYKLELIDDLEKEGGKKVSVYKTGEFTDLCKGPHVKDAKEINPEAIKLTRLAGAYWKGSEKNKMLTRIYGVAFETKEELQKYLGMMKEAELRNHRKLGKELELFAIFPEVGQGLPVWLPKGYAIRKVLEDYMIKLERSFGYEHIVTPHINKKELFEKSGHLDFYRESMYSPLEIDDETFYLKPMNCPTGILVYAMKPRSYRDLPYKLGELGTVYRYEQSGELHGLQRVRGFTQNDAHIFCTPEQLKEQFIEVFKIVNILYKDLGFDNYKFRLSLSDFKNNPDKYVGDKKQWEQVEQIMRDVMAENKIDFYEAEGEAAFYGPKVDVQAINVYGKEDSISTIQVDFNLPERFNLSYIDKEGNKKRPFMIHRALIGSFERFFAFLIEYYAGAFPVWLAPVQAVVIPVSENFNDYGKKVVEELKANNIRAELNNSDESLGKRIREAQKQKTPYMLIVGEKEEKVEAVSVRQREKGDQGSEKLADFIKKIKKELK